ncbi:MAG: 4-alpha-glucanotransferase [Dehalococcoidales bacterium]|nr:4-alpha-glucanotransferase [Dehalococcoidales bacterium]
MSFPRASGILLHPTSLPGRFGIGDLGPNAYRFADFLAGAGQRLWQVLPLTLTGYGDSPYQCLSVFAGNPLFISLEKLAEDGFLERTDLEDTPTFSEHRVDYGAVINFKLPLMRKSFAIFDRRATRLEREQFEAFCEQNASWLETYSLFMALKEAHGLAAWHTWAEDIRRRQPAAMEGWRQKLEDQIGGHKYQQYHFFQQWSALKKYCRDREVRLIGDMPIFVALDSAEVWSHPELFFLDENGQPTVVAGVPPDYFSRTGQLWGNPVYCWDEMAGDGYRWWIERFQAMLSMVDIIRLDHFRGFEKYWEVPATETTAVNGRWVAGPGAGFFAAIEQALGKLPIIAEDLGVITAEVDTLREQFDFPGMKVLQFAFGSDDKGNRHQPHNYERNCVVYTGTHDNNTTIGWFNEEAGAATLSREEREQERRLALDYLGTDGHEINWDFIRLALLSVADTAIIPLQDVLGLGSQARMNQPGASNGNWRWRFTMAMLTEEIKDRLKRLTTIYGRGYLVLWFIISVGVIVPPA